MFGPHTHTTQQFSGRMCTIPYHRKSINSYKIRQHAVHS